MSWNLIVHLKSSKDIVTEVGESAEDAKKVLADAQEALTSAYTPTTLVTIAGSVSVRPADVEAMEIAESFGSVLA